MSRSVSPEGLALIKGFEGFRAEPALLPDGSWVVGHGHVRIGEPGAAVTEAEASELLALDLAPVERSVAANAFQELSQAQFDALCSFAFSIGVEAFEKSAVLRRVNAGMFIAAACAMDAWRKSDARGELEIIEALIRRRAAEKAMFLAGAPGEGAPSALVRAKLDYAASVLGAPLAHRRAPTPDEVPPKRPQPDPAQRLSEILKSEPATEALLLTRVATPEEVAAAETEIATAHAKPVARFVRPLASRTAALEQLASVSAAVGAFAAATTIAAKSVTLQLPRLAAPLLNIASRIKVPRARLVRPVETFSLVALFAFGAGLVTLAFGALIGGRPDFADILGAAALAAPGVFAMFLSVYGLVKGPVEKTA